MVTNISEFMQYILTLKKYFKSCHPTPWRDLMSRPIAPVSLVAGGDYTTSPRLQGNSC
jgi:hypothetical protein